MTSEAWDKFKEKRKKAGGMGREKIYLLLVSSVIIMCALGTISSFTKVKILEETSEYSDHKKATEDESGLEDLDEDDDNSDDYEDEDYEDEDAENLENSEDYEYDDWKDTYFGEEIWIG